MRIKISKKYIPEREELCNKIIDIIELDSENCFLLSNIDEDTNK
jgi:hypothetical protein